MKRADNHIPGMQQLADEGWMQMREMLRKEGLAEIKEAPVSFLKKSYLITGIAVCLLTIIIIFLPFQLFNSRLVLSGLSPQKMALNEPLQNVAKNESKVKEEIKESLETSKKIVTPKKIILNSSHTVYVPTGKNDLMFLDSLVKASLARNVPVEKNIFIKDFKIIDRTGTIKKETLSIPKTKKLKNSFLKKLQIYAGVSTNIPSTNNGLFSFEASKLNIHPSFTLIVPLHEKLSLHTGLFAMSTIHSKEVTTKEKEVINNMAANVFYKINTTSIIKASYFDLPVTLHYNLSQNWSVGAGIQLSKLYKVNVKEQKESYDYNNSLIETTTLRYNSNASQAATTFQKKVEIKSFEPRFLFETGLKQGPWLFSAGYYYAVGKSITLQQPNGASQQYNNQYLKLGVQYRFDK